MSTEILHEQGETDQAYNLMSQALELKSGDGKLKK